MKAGLPLRTTVSMLALLAALYATQGAGAIPPPVKGKPAVPAPTGYGPQVDAANALLALPWDGQRRQAEQDALAGMAGLEGKKLARGNGNVGGLRWSFDIGVQNVSGAVDLSSPPGFRSASPSGFTVEAPLGRTWSFGVSGGVRAHAKVTAAGQTLADYTSPDLRFGLRIPDLHLTASTLLDASNPDAPRFVSATLVPRFTIVGSGIIPTIPVNLTVRIADGKVVISTSVVGASMRLGSLDGVLNGRLVLTLLPIQQSLYLSSPFGSTDLLFQEANLSLEGTLAVSLERVGKVSMPFDLSSGVLLPSSRSLQLALVGLKPPLPRVWPPTAAQLAPPSVAPSGFDFRAPALQIDEQTNPATPGGTLSHLPYGAVLSIDRRNGKATYGREADSAIWTGHYLAAEAFRYAATSSPDALARVRQTIAGIGRLFTVADAAVEGAKIGPAENGLLSRTAFPAFPKGEGLTDGPLQLRRGACYYEHPSGGWKLSGRSQTYPTYAAALKAARGGSLPGRVVLKPVGTIWYGFGCGSKPARDHTISRDQYNGVFMGLAYAYALVPDPAVQSAAKGLIERSLDFLLLHRWNIPLPPTGRIGTTYLGDLDTQLAYLRIGKTIDPAKYGAIYDRFAPASALMWIPTWLSDLDPVVQYYKFNLGEAVYGPAVLFEQDAQLRSNYLRAYRILRHPTALHRNAYFDAVDLLVGASAASSSSPVGYKTVGAEITGTLYEWLQRRQLLAGPEGLPTNVVSDHAANAIIGLWPGNVRPVGTLYGGAPLLATAALPVQNRIGNGMDFVWEHDPFSSGLALGAGQCTLNAFSAAPTPGLIKTCGSDKLQREGPGVDYLLPYWMSVYLRVLPAA